MRNIESRLVPRGDQEKNFLGIASSFTKRSYPSLPAAVYAMKAQHDHVMPIKDKNTQTRTAIVKTYRHIDAIEHLAESLIKDERYEDALKTANLFHQITEINSQSHMPILQLQTKKTREELVKEWISSVDPDLENDMFDSSLRFHRLLAEQIVESGRARNLHINREYAKIKEAREGPPQQEYDTLRDFIHMAVLFGDFDNGVRSQFDPYAVMDARIVMDSYPLTSPPPVD